MTNRPAKWNVERGLIRVWVVAAAIWLLPAAGIWLSSWSHEIGQLTHELITRFTLRVDYDAICAKLRAQKAASGRAEPIPALPPLELVVENGVATVVAAPGSCLAEIAKEDGVSSIPVAMKVVGGDGSKPAWLKDMNGKVRPFDFPPWLVYQSAALESVDLVSMMEDLVFVLSPPWSCSFSAGQFGGQRSDFGLTM